MTRAELDRVVDILNRRSAIIDQLAHNLDIQFQRIAQLQADLDLAKRAWSKSKPPRT